MHILKAPICPLAILIAFLSAATCFYSVQASSSDRTVYQEVRRHLAGGDNKKALAVLGRAASKGAGANKQAYRQRQQLLSQVAPLAEEPQRLHIFDAMNARERGDLNLAIMHCNQVVSARPVSVFSDDAQNLLAYISLVDQLDFLTARRQYGRLRERYPSSNYLDAALFGEALALEKMGYIEEAVELNQQLLKKHTGVSVGFLGIAYPKDNFLSRLWFNRAEAKLDALTERQSAALPTTTNPGLIMGARLSYDQPVGSGVDFRSTSQWLRKYNVPATHIAHWLTETTAWPWESSQKVAAASRAGYTPLLIDWYYGDKISPALVAKTRKEYLHRLKHNIIPLLQQAPTAMIVLEPEFNKNGMEDWRPWGELMLDSIRLIHDYTSARVGLAIGDWADFDDPRSLGSIAPAIAESDFIAFLIMTSRQHEGAFHSPNNDLGTRFDRAMSGLKQRYDLPIVLAYTAISSADGWEAQQAHYLRELLAIAAHYPADELEAVGYFSLFDNPKQSGWFGRSENSFGVLDKSGNPKPALDAWRDGANQLWGRDKSPPTLGSSNLSPDDDGGVSFNASFSEWTRWELEFSIEGRQVSYQRQGTGRSARARVSAAQLRSARNDRMWAVLNATDAAGNVLRRSFSIDLEYASESATYLSLPRIEWRHTEGVNIEDSDQKPSRLRFSQAYGQLRIPIGELPKNSSILMEVGSETPLNGLYLAIEASSGIRHRVTLDHLLPRNNPGARVEIEVPAKELLNAIQRLTPSGTLSSAPTTGTWKELIIENSASPTEFDLYALTIAVPQTNGRPFDETTRPLTPARPLTPDRWGR